MISRNNIRQIVFLLAAFVYLGLNGPVALALTQAQKDTILSGARYFNTEEDGGVQCSSAPTIPSSTSAGPVYFVGDSIGARSSSALSSGFNGKGITSKINSVSSRNLSGAPPSPDGLGAVDADQAFIKTAGSVVIELGTNGGGFSASSVSQMITKIRGYNNSAKIYWVDLAEVGRSDFTSYSTRNRVIYDSSSSNGYNVISWAKTVYGSSVNPSNIPASATDPNGYIDTSDGLGVHPSVPKGVNAFANTIVSAVTGGSGVSGPGAGSCACTAGGTSTLEGSDNAERTWNYFIGKGLSAAQVAAIMGNFSQEDSFNPKALQGGGESDSVPLDGNTGYGIAQWTYIDRQRALDQFARDQNRPVGSLDLQLDFAFKEMTDSSPNDVFDRLKTYGNSLEQIEQATEYFHDSFEGSGDDADGIQERKDDAKGWFAKYGSGTGSPGAPATPSCPGGGGSTPGSPTNEYGTCSANGVAYEGQYSEAQLYSIFGPPARTNGDANLVGITFFGRSFKIHKSVAPCLKAVEQEIIANGITYRPEDAKGGIGCVRYTDSGGIGDRSYHVYGAACDINPGTNNLYDDAAARPYNPNCPISSSYYNSGNCYDMPSDFIAAFRNHGFTWGGTWNSLKDYMHLEWHGVRP